MYTLVKFLRQILLKSPLWFCFLLGKTIGGFLYLNQRKRKTAFQNIKIAFPEKTNRQTRKIIRKSFENIGLSIIEILIAPRVYKYIKILGEENLTETDGIITGVHEGNHELFSFKFAQKYKFAVLAKKQKNKGMDKALNELRTEYKVEVCFSLKELLRRIKNGFMTAALIDHGAEDNADYIEFFSQSVPTPGGAVYLARKFNKNIYPCFQYRGKKFQHIIEIAPPLNPQGRDSAEILKQLNSFYEKKLEQHPNEYLWTYKRFKRKKTLNVLILNDTKTGHLKQSKAFLSFLSEFFLSEKDYKIRSTLIEVTYKNRLTRILSEICACFMGKRCIGCGRCHKFLLEKHTYKKIKSIYADIVVSTGSSIAAINKLTASYLNAKSVVILRPNIPLRKFDLAIVPEHDRIYAKNVVKTKGALFYPADSSDNTSRCEKFFNLTGDKKISLFLGGALSDNRGFLSNLEIFLTKLKNFSLAKGYKLLISTSRRTPVAVETYLEKELSGFINTKTVVYANRNNYDFVFEGFISLSEIVFVTSESISMLSEILSLKKPCVCVLLEKHTDKHQVFLQSIKNEVNFLKYPYNIEELTNLKVSSIFEENRKVIKTAIKKLL